MSDMCSQARSKGCDRSLLHFGHSRPSDFKCLLSILPILRFLLVLSLRYIGLAWVVLPKVARRSERLDLCSPVVPASPQIQQLLDSGFTSSEVPYLSFIDRPVWVATCCQLITRSAAAKCKAIISRAHTSSTYDEERTATIFIIQVRMHGSRDCLRDFCVFGDDYWTKYCANCHSNQNDLNSQGREKLALSIGLIVDLRETQGS